MIVGLKAGVWLTAVVQGISFVGYTGVEGADLACGTYKTYALYLHKYEDISLVN